MQKSHLSWQHVYVLNVYVLNATRGCYIAGNEIRMQMNEIWQLGKKWFYKIVKGFFTKIKFRMSRYWHFTGPRATINLQSNP